MSNHLGPAVAATAAAVGIPTIVHLPAPSCSLLPEVPPANLVGT